jgi:hypothetical protein
MLADRYVVRTMEIWSPACRRVAVLLNRYLMLQVAFILRSTLLILLKTLEERLVTNNALRYLVDFNS